MGVSPVKEALIRAQLELAAHGQAAETEATCTAA